MIVQMFAQTNANPLMSKNKHSEFELANEYSHYKRHKISYLFVSECVNLNENVDDLPRMRLNKESRKLICIKLDAT